MRLFRTNYTAEPDEKLMQLVAKGDQQAFEVLYDRYSRPMLNYFYRMLWKDREKAEDFMQDIFTKLVQKPHLYDPKRKFKTWLYSIANNMCKNEYRKQEVRKNTSGGLDENVGVENDGVRQDKRADLNSFSDALDEALQGLSEDHRNTFIMRFKMELSIKEIADVMDCSPGTVKSRIFYLLKKLSGELKEFDPTTQETK